MMGAFMSMPGGHGTELSAASTKLAPAKRQPARAGERLGRESTMGGQRRMDERLRSLPGPCSREFGWLIDTHI